MAHPGTSVRGGSILSEWLTHGFVSIPGSRLPRLPVDPDDTAIAAAVEEGYDSLGYSQKAAKVEEVRAFVRMVRPGDLVVATSDEDVYIGRVTGDLPVPVGKPACAASSCPVGVPVVPP